MPEISIIKSNKASRREWIGLAILTLPTLLVSIDMTVTYLALPAISAALKPSSSELLWITDIYGFLEAGLLVVMGSLGDRIGLRKMLMTGGSAFALASVWAAFSHNATMLILSRAILGIAGATILPITLSLIRNMFLNDVQRTFAMGLYTTCFSAGTMLGPMIGGFLLNHFWWGSVFLIAVPIMLLLLLFAPFFLPEYKDEKAGKIDLPSAILLIVASLLTIFGIKEIAQNGIGWLATFTIVTGVSIGFLFYQRQKSLSDPLVNLSLFKNSNFTMALTALLAVVFSWAGIFLFIGQYLQLVVGFDPFTAGLWTMPGAVGSIILCTLAPIAVKYIRRNYLIATGLLIVSIGISLVALINIHSFALFITATVLMSGGCGVAVTLGIDMVIASAPPEKAGAAAGISETSTGIGAALGVALLGSLWTVLYRNNLTLPSNISQTDAKTIRGTLGGALSVAKELNSSDSEALIRSARESFMHSLNITARHLRSLIIYCGCLDFPSSQNSFLH
jgi:DHA2 family multidrug resistance protein-like MFS transporter